MTLSPMQIALQQRLQPLNLQKDGSCLTTLCFDHDFIGFAGHFPQKPILPAVCMMAAATLMTATLMNIPLRLLGIPLMKFRRQVRPDDNLQFIFSPESCDGNRYIYDYTLTLLPEGKPVARFKLTLAKES